MISPRSLFGNMFVQMISRAAAIILGLVAIGIMSRVLGTARMGEYTTALTFLQLFGVLVDFGLTLTLVVMISEPKADESKVVSNIFTMRLILGVIFYALAPLLSLLVTPWSDSIRETVAIVAVASLISSSTSVVTGLFQKHAVMWRAGVTELVNRIVMLIAVIAVAAWSPTAQAMAATSILGNVACLFATAWFARSYARVTLRFDLDVWKAAASRSWPIALSTLLNMVYLRGDVFFLSLFRPLEVVGVYGLAYRVIDVLTALPVMFMGLLIPSLVTDWAEARHQEFRNHLNRAFDFFAILGIPIVIGAQATAIPLTILIAGEEFAESGHVLKALIFAVFGVFFGGLYGWTVVAIKKQHTATWLYGATAAVALVGYLTLVPRFGMWGAVSVTILSESMVAFGTFWLVRRATGATPNLKTAAKALLSSIVMYLVLVAIPWVPVVIQIVIGALVYGVVMLAIGGIKISTIRELMPRRIAEHKPVSGDSSLRSE